MPAMTRSILTHGSDLRLAATIRPLVVAGDGTVRTALGELAKWKIPAVQLDATLAGIRPRDLSQRARKDLAALIARQGLQLAGVDLFLPRQHYTDPQHVDRAVTATLAAIELAADLGKATLSLGLPVAEVSEEVRRTLVEAADGRGVRLAVHAEDQLDALKAWLEAVDQHALGAGLDPAACLARSLKPVRTAAMLGKRLAVARLSDVTGGALRCAVGEGELELAAYRVAVDLAPSRAGPVVLDLRGVEDPIKAARAAAAAWDNAAFAG